MKVIIPCTLLSHAILQRLKPHISLSLHKFSPHFSSLPEERQKQIVSYVVSLINALIMTGMSSIQLWTRRGKTRWSDESNNSNSSQQRPSTLLSRQMLAMELVYFADDLFSNFRILTLADMIHHASAILALSTAISAYRRTPKVQYVIDRYFPRIMIAEASTIFLDLAFILKGLQMNGTLGLFLQKMAQLAFAALFMVIRVGYLPWVVLQMMKEGSIQRIGGKAGIALSMTVVFLQLYWFVKIVHRFRREFLGQKEKKPLRSRM